jgi:hypothetical protein
MRNAAPKILDDPIVPRLVDLESELNKTTIAFIDSATQAVKSPPFRTLFIMRSR